LAEADEMTNRWLVLLGTSIFTLTVTGVKAPAQAASISFSIMPFAGDPSQVRFTLTDLAANGVNVKAEVLNPPSIGDIVGIFFNLDSSIAIPQLSISNPSGTDPLRVSSSKGKNQLFLDNSGSTTDRSKKLDNNVNLNGDGIVRVFDAAVQVGEGGLKNGDDDYQWVSFDLTATGLDVSDFETVGVRLQSVGTAKRKGSSKLEGEVPEIPNTLIPTGIQNSAVPEPLTLLGAGAAAGFGALFKKRLARSRKD
jgi:hypothetical protein